LLAWSLVAVVQFCSGDVRGEAGQREGLRAGLARVCITPEETLWLHGYAGKPRFRPFEGKLNDLFAKAMALEDARGERAVLITVDLCVIRAAEAKALFDRLTERTGLQRRQLLVNFSHTHSGPIIGSSDLDRYPMSAEERQATQDYTAGLYEKIADAAVAALADLKPATLAWGVGKCSFVRNRRLYNPDGSYRGMGPNADKYVDDTVPVLRVSTPAGTLRGIVFGCACHPVTFGPESLKLSGDYASFAQEEIEASHPGAQAMFVQGCGADANSDPRCGPDAEKHARLQGQLLAAEVDRILKQPLEPIRGPLQVKFREVDLPLKPVPDRAELVKMSGTLAHNAKRMLAAIDGGQPLTSHHKHPLALWQFGKDLTLVALSGEVVSGYVPLLQRALGAGRLWIAGYSNEVDGYLPDATMVAEGGYEARGLVADIGFYSADAEPTLVNAVRALQADTRSPFALWDEDVPFPTRESLAYPDGATDVMVHRAGADGYNFLHDSAIVQHQGSLFAAWYNCPQGEMVGESLIRGRRSQDGGRTWSDVETIASDVNKQGIMYVPVAFLSHGGTLYAFITNMKGGPDLVHHCEVFVLDEKVNTWISRGFIAGPFLPNCAPQRLADGNFIMSGRMSDQPGQKPTIPAVAISRGEDFAQPWALVRLLPTGKLDDGQRIPCPETTVLVEGRELTALVRRENAKSLVFFSHDNGQTWSEPCEHNFPMASSKIYAGLLSTGQRYLLCNLPTSRRRDLLVIAVSRPGEKAFVKMWKVRDGYDPALKAGPEWSYPCAIEADGKLHVVYTSEKHHCAMTVIPVESLAAQACPDIR